MFGPVVPPSFTVFHSLPANLWAFVPPESNITALSERLATDIAGIQGAQVILNISNAATHTALQVVNATMTSINARLSITETDVSNAATRSALQVVNTALQVINVMCHPISHFN